MCSHLICSAPAVWPCSFCLPLGLGRVAAGAPAGVALVVTAATRNGGFVSAALGVPSLPGFKLRLRRLR